MQAKALEIRDDETFIAALAVNMNPKPLYQRNGSLSEEELAQNAQDNQAQTYLLLRCGYRCDGKPNIILTRLAGNGQATNDPYAWESRGRTMPVAHNFIIEHWEELIDGDVIDVQHILGETKEPKKSEREIVVPR